MFINVLCSMCLLLFLNHWWHCQRILMTHTWVSLSDLWQFYMTAWAAYKKSTKSGKSFSQERGDPLTTSLPLKHPSSTQATCHESCLPRRLYMGTVLKPPTLPSPSRWGWQLENSRWVPHRTTLSQAEDSCCELIRCGCKAGCQGRCKCQKASFTCTGLCNCGGNCN